MERSDEEQLLHLEFLFGVLPGEREDLTAHVTEIVEEYRVKLKQTLRVNFQTQASTEKNPSTKIRATIKGQLEAVDACHGKLSEEVCSKWLSKRLVDDVGAELRRRAYPYLAKTEELLRRFIVEALVEVLGFSWWDELHDNAVTEHVVSRMNQSDSVAAFQQFIDFTHFEHLVQFITADLSRWDEDDTLTIGRLKELIDGVEDLPELLSAIDKKTKRQSLWDSVFKSLFASEDAWRNAKAVLEELMKYRHRVMHHRPMRLYELKKVESLCAEISDALTLDAEKMEEPQRQKLRETTEKLLSRSSSRRLINSSLQTEMLGLNSGLFKAAEQAEQAKRQTEMLGLNSGLFKAAEQAEQAKRRAEMLGLNSGLFKVAEQAEQAKRRAEMLGLNSGLFKAAEQAEQAKRRAEMLGLNSGLASRVKQIEKLSNEHRHRRSGSPNNAEEAASVESREPVSSSLKSEEANEQEVGVKESVEASPHSPSEAGSDQEN